MDKMERRYPVGIQTFEKIRKENYLYIDKTDLVWLLTKVSPFIFLSRPRRFGKSLLTTTFDSYFKGQRELFEGLKIMDLETEWEQHPVIHIDNSRSTAPPKKPSNKSTATTTPCLILPTDAKW
ncbi:MAG: AAA family ATPase [Bacteroidaceae bacterium]|nr:AAA family ATPase [Bacteroidaceae bacterium]